MKQLISLLICVLILAVPAATQQTPQTQSTPSWNLYTVKGERFSIALPVLPMLTAHSEIRKRPLPDRQIRVIECTSKGVAYVITIIENPKPRVSLEKFIKEQAAAAPAETLTSERDINLDGIAGKEFDYPDGKGTVRFFAKDDRLYDVRAYGASVDDPKIKTFFNYLSLKKEEGAIEVSENVQARAIDANTESIFIGKEVDTKIRLLKKPEPNYTHTAKSEQIRGTVILKCVFASDGTVTNIRVVQGLPNGLTEKAIEAARKIKFIPATKDGKNVSMWMQLEYNFNLY